MTHIRFSESSSDWGTITGILMTWYDDIPNVVRHRAYNSKKLRTRKKYKKLIYSYRNVVRVK